MIKKINSHIIPIKNIDQTLKDSMFDLMERYYENTFREDFDNDLRDKQWVITLTDASNQALVGFSTAIAFDHIFENKKVLIVFSGDTIIQKEYWGSLELALAFGSLLLSLKNEQSG